MHITAFDKNNLSIIESIAEKNDWFFEECSSNQLAVVIYYDLANN